MEFHQKSLVLGTTTAQVASPQDYAVCREIMLKASNHCFGAYKYLPTDRLPHVEALFALVRVGDDRVTVSHLGFPTPLAAIDDWEQQYRQAFERGSSPHPVLRAYLDTSIKFGISKELMAQYFQAMREDLTIQRFATFSHLLHYIDRSAVPIGRAMTHILGVRHPWMLGQALAAADALSIAMQLTNFWRDIGEDWRRGRITLPQEDMQHYKVSEDDLAHQRIDYRFRNLLEFEFHRTVIYFEQARKSVHLLASGRWAVMTALEYYKGILTIIRNHRYDVYSSRADVSRINRIILAAKAFWQVNKR